MDIQHQRTLIGPQRRTLRVWSDLDRRVRALQRSRGLATLSDAYRELVKAGLKSQQRRENRDELVPP
jgi:hypothetical protein